MHFCTLVSAICILASSGLAQTPGFDPKDVIRQVRSAHSTPGSLEPLNPASDDGEFLIDTSGTLGPAPYGQGHPALAFDGVNFLVVWEDGRKGDSADVYGARVTPAGVVLDPTGIAISTAAENQFAPVLAFDGANFLVVWTDQRSGTCSGIYGARVTTAGVVLDAQGLAISTAPDGQGLPALAFDGENFLVVWNDRRSGQDIYGARVTPAGVVLDPQGIAISTAADYQWSPALAFDGENFLVAWTDRRGVDNTDIYGARVTPAGVVLDPAGVAISTATGNQESPAVAASGESLFVVWRDSRSGPYTYDVYGARVTPAGVVLDPQGIAISTATGNQREPALAFDGTNLLVAWNDGRNGGYDIYGARVTPAGVVLDAQGIAISTTPGYGGPALAFDGENSLVVWEDERYGGYGDIYGTQVTPAGVVLDPEGIAISTAAEGQVYPALAFDGENFLAVWQGWYSNDIYGARVTPAGGVLDPSGILISTAAGYPALAFGGENFLVTWSYGYDIYGARVTPAGGVLDPQGIVISTAADGEYPVPAFDGENFLVVWGDIRSDSWDIYGARVTPAGIVLDPSGFPISTAFEGQLYPAIAFGEENFFAVWEDRRSETDNIYGARVTPAGAVLDPAGIAISSDVNSDERNPILGFDGENFLVVWHDLFGTHPSGLYGARVTPAGAVLDPNGIPISTATGYQYFPALAFDGTNFLAVWEDLRSGSDIYGARVTPAGVVFDSGPVVRQEGSQSCPALARGSGNDMFLVYQGWAGSVGGKTYNTQRIWGKMNPRPAVAEMTKPEARMTSSGAAIIRGVLFTPASGVEHEASSILLDICGRKVRELVPGANDVRALAPGVYFVRWRDSRGQGVEDSRVTKVVIQR